MARPLLLFVPLDDRPVTCEMVVELARAAGVEVRVPDRALLGDRDRLGDAEELRRWLEGEVVAGGAAALIASVEMLCFGGLVASRKSTAEFVEVAPDLARILALAEHLPSYLSAAIPRTPVVPTGEDASYWKAYGEALRHVATAALSPGTSTLLDELDSALEAAGIPQPARGEVVTHRNRHLRINAELIAAASRGTLRYVLIGQDDTAPGSLSELERGGLQTLLDSTGTTNVLLTSGADELNARLLARWLNDLTGRRPRVQVVYTFPWNADAVPLYEARPLSATVVEHITGTGCSVETEDPEIVLWVHNFEQQSREAAGQDDLPPALDPAGPVVRTVRAAVREERVVALADVRFANGGDRGLVAKLLEERRFAGIVAYAGWNTCSNTLGSALAQAVIVAHLRAGTLPGSDRLYRPAFFRRILDDWGYQAITRPMLRDWLEQRSGDPASLGSHEAEVEREAFLSLRDEVLPALRHSFAYHPVYLQAVTFPWHRLFEVRFDLEVPPVSRGRQQIVVVDYDPRWPEMYEADRAAILEALGPMVRDTEHAGSTAVPGLAAKPIIDVLLGVHADDLDRIIAPLAEIGYEYSPDWEISLPMRRYFRRLAPDGAHTHHLHAVPFGGEFWTRHLAFRDYLRAHPEAVREYGELKRRVARTERNSLDYTFAKTAFIRSIESQAGVTRAR